MRSAEERRLKLKHRQYNIVRIIYIYFINILYRSCKNVYVNNYFHLPIQPPTYTNINIKQLCITVYIYINSNRPHAGLVLIYASSLWYLRSSFMIII
jgi:hypothetical protein